MLENRRPARLGPRNGDGVETEVGRRGLPLGQVGESRLDYRCLLAGCDPCQRIAELAGSCGLDFHEYYAIPVFRDKIDFMPCEAGTPIARQDLKSQLLQILSGEFLSALTMRMSSRVGTWRRGVLWRPASRPWRSR